MASKNRAWGHYVPPSEEVKGKPDLLTQFLIKVKLLFTSLVQQDIQQHRDCVSTEIFDRVAVPLGR